jgi:Tfp pilus assembly protein PilV
MIFNFSKSKGMTLAEVIIALGIFTLFVGAVLTAILADAQNGPINKHRLQAANLAREGIQQVSQIRDMAWIKGHLTATEWENNGNVDNDVEKCYGLAQGTGKGLNFVTSSAPALCNFDHWRLVAGADNVTLNGIQYTRDISIANKFIFTPNDYAQQGLTPPASNAKLVTVTVSWSENGTTKDLTFKKLITDWKAI